jgi:hypothetical protein
MRFTAAIPMTRELMMTNENNSDDTLIDAQIAVVRTALPTWTDEALQLVELAANAERAAASIDPRTDERARKLIVEIAEWQERLAGWQQKQISGRLGAELNILKATLDAAIDEANAAARALGLMQ